jgi:hypothetical protein
LVSEVQRERAATHEVEVECHQLGDATSQRKNLYGLQWCHIDMRRCSVAAKEVLSGGERKGANDVGVKLL